MQKLVFVHHWGDEGCYGTSTIPFEYKSKEDFVFDILEQFKGHKWEGKYATVKLKKFDIYLEQYEINDIERNVFTLEEWFELNKA